MSNKIEKIFYDYFEQKGLTAETIGLNGRSDHAPFVAMGIPVGGLFSGDEGLKTAEQAESCGGTPDEPYDPCYHKPCDDITNISEQALEELSKAAAYAIDYFANNTSAFEKGIPDERELPMPASRPLPESDYIGPLLYR
jgi:Zn-dependent M28 family amino/carboxypeptidase